LHGGDRAVRVAADPRLARVVVLLAPRHAGAGALGDEQFAVVGVDTGMLIGYALNCPSTP